MPRSLQELHAELVRRYVLETPGVEAPDPLLVEVAHAFKALVEVATITREVLADVQAEDGCLVCGWLAGAGGFDHEDECPVPQLEEALGAAGPAEVPSAPAVAEVTIRCGVTGEALTVDQAVARMVPAEDPKIGPQLDPQAGHVLLRPADPQLGQAVPVFVVGRTDSHVFAATAFQPVMAVPLHRWQELMRSAADFTAEAPAHFRRAFTPPAGGREVPDDA